MKIVNKLYNIKNDINKNIVLISDIHYYSKKDINHLNKILDNIKHLKPNYICIAGDITDESAVKDEDIFINWLLKLSLIAKVMICIGNHEYYIDKKAKLYKLNKIFLDKIKNIENVYLLDNKNIIIDNINFIGINLPAEYYMEEKENKKAFLNHIKKIGSINNMYNILLCHSPVNLTNKDIIIKLNLDLVLCGHMHGGVVLKAFRPMFKNGGLISPQKKLFPKDCYGHIKIVNTNIIISSGVSVISHINKFYIFKNLFASEIVSIKLSNF